MAVLDSILTVNDEDCLSSAVDDAEVCVFVCCLCAKAQHIHHFCVFAQKPGDTITTHESSCMYVGVCEHQRASISSSTSSLFTGSWSVEVRVAGAEAQINSAVPSEAQCLPAHNSFGVQNSISIHTEGLDLCLLKHNSNISLTPNDLRVACELSKQHR